MTPRKRPGRPPLDKDSPSVGIHVKVSSRTYDVVYACARRERVSVPEVVRRVLTRLTRHGSPGTDSS